MELPKQKLLLEQVYELISQRNSDFQSSFLVTPPSLLLNESNSDDINNEDIQIIFKNYATLYFTFIVDDQESELAILDLIQTFVESLDRCFTEVNDNFGICFQLANFAEYIGRNCTGRDGLKPT